MIKIGEAYLSENGNTKGKAGDQTGKEVRVASFKLLSGTYNHFRFKDKTVADKMAHIIRCLCENDLVGYSQLERNTLYRNLWQENFNHTKLARYSNTDCSALVNAVCVCAGIENLKYDPFDGNAFTTRNMTEKLLASGFNKVSGDPLPGDIYVWPGKHTFMITNEGAPAYNTGKVYTLKSAMNVRPEPSLNNTPLKAKDMTANARKNLTAAGRLRSGTRVTCKEIREDKTRVWMRIPSGWIVAYNKKTDRVYIG